MKIGHIRRLSILDEDDSDEDDSDEALPEYVPLLLDCPYVTPEAHVEWFQEIQSGDEDAMIALILTLLPRLQTLQIEPYPNDFYLKLIVRRIASASQRSDQPQALSQLEALIVLKDGVAEGTDIEMIECFAALPPMRHIKAVNSWEENTDCDTRDGYDLIFSKPKIRQISSEPESLTESTNGGRRGTDLRDTKVLSSWKEVVDCDTKGGYDLQPSKPRTKEREAAFTDESEDSEFSSRSAGVLEMELAGSIFAPGRISDLLSRINVLERFKLTTHNENYVPKTLLMNPYIVRECLQRFAKDTLLYLDIHVITYERDRFMGSFTGFEILQELHVDILMFLDRRKNRMHSLSTMLPRSIEKVVFYRTLFMDPRFYQVMSLLLDFKPEAFPKLRSIIFSSLPSLSDIPEAAARLFAFLLLGPVPFCPDLVEVPRTFDDLEKPFGGLYVGVRSSVGDKGFKVGKNACPISHDHCHTRLECLEPIVQLFQQSRDFDAAARAIEPYLDPKLFES